MRVVIWENIRGEGYWNVHFIKESLQNQFSKIMMPQLLGELILVSDWLFDFFFCSYSYLSATTYSIFSTIGALSTKRRKKNLQYPPSTGFSNYHPHITLQLRWGVTGHHACNLNQNLYEYPLLMSVMIVEPVGPFDVRVIVSGPLLLAGGSRSGGGGWHCHCGSKNERTRKWTN